MLRRGLVFLLVSAAMLAAGLLTYRVFRLDIDGARSAVARDSRMISTSAGAIEYAEKGDGAPLLSIHGAGGGFDQGIAIATDLVGTSYRIIAPSRFGYLGTAVPSDHSAAAQAKAHVALLDALHIDKAVVVGTSAGARSATWLAARYPERVAALILIVPATYAPENPVKIEESHGSKFAFWLVNAGADFAWWAMTKTMPSVLIRFVGVPPDLVAAASKDEQARVMQLLRSTQPLSRRVAGINIDSTPPREPPRLEAISAPTLVITARDDLFNTRPAAEFAAKRIPDAKLIVYDRGGHLLVGREGDVRAEVAAFLSDIDARKPTR